MLTEDKRSSYLLQRVQLLLTRLSGTLLKKQITVSEKNIKFKNAVWIEWSIEESESLITIDRSSRLRPQRTCEQEHVGLSNAFLHNSAARMSDLTCRPSLRCDWSIRNGAEPNGSVYSFWSG